MAIYEIEISRSAERQLRRLDRAAQERVGAAIRALARDPRPRGSRKLQGYEDVFRVRVGSYRVLYSISGSTLIIVILKRGHRKEVYR